MSNLHSLFLIVCSACENLYPFFYKLDFKSTTDGWSLASLDSHFKAMFGVDPNDAKAMETVDWKISSINEKYEVVEDLVIGLVPG